MMSVPKRKNKITRRGKKILNIAMIERNFMQGSIVMILRTKERR